MEFNRFDVSAKELVWDEPDAWLDRLGIGPPGPVYVIDSNITTLTADADKVIRVGGPQPYLVNVEFQSSHQTDLLEIVWFRQAALFHRHRLSVLTVLVLLRPDANSPRLDGTFEIKMPDGWLTNRYNYLVVRLWEDDPEPYLTGGVSLVPLAPMTRVAETEESLRGLVRRMAERIDAEPESRAAKLGSATYLLMGLRYEDKFASQLLDGVQNMKESTTYQAILREGATRAASRVNSGCCFVWEPSGSASPTKPRGPPSRRSRILIGSKPWENVSSTPTSTIGKTCCARRDPRSRRCDSRCRTTGDDD